MRKSLQRLAIGAAAAVTPLMFATMVSPAVASACAPGQWWDPVANRCQGPLVPNCENGWWDPVANTCRPPVSTTPLGCENGWWWDPVANVCRPPLLPG